MSTHQIDLDFDGDGVVDLSIDMTPIIQATEDFAVGVQQEAAPLFESETTQQWLDELSYFTETLWEELEPLASKLWDLWATLFPDHWIWQPWGAACALALATLVLTRFMQRLFATAAP